MRIRMLARVAVGMWLAMGLLVLFAASNKVFFKSAEASSSVRVIKLLDDCEPASFNAAIEPGTCVGKGETTFAQFIAQLQEDRVADDWEFSPDETKVGAGRAVVAQNRGGETHTFTKVAEFGGGFVPELNELSGNPIPRQECLQDRSATHLFIPAGGTASAPALGVGVTKFQCCIHPWMRTTITVREKQE